MGKDKDAIPPKDRDSKGRTKIAVKFSQTSYPQSVVTQKREIPRLHSQGETRPLDEYLQQWYVKYIQNATSVTPLIKIAQAVGEEEIHLAFLLQIEQMLQEKATELGVKPPKLPNIEETLMAFEMTCKNSGVTELKQVAASITAIIRTIRNEKTPVNTGELRKDVQKILTKLDNNEVNSGTLFKKSDLQNIAIAIDRRLDLLENKENLLSKSKL
jgi:hypothetical protein